MSRPPFLRFALTMVLFLSASAAVGVQPPTEPPADQYCAWCVEWYDEGWLHFDGAFDGMFYINGLVIHIPQGPGTCLSQHNLGCDQEDVEAFASLVQQADWNAVRSHVRANPSRFRLEGSTVTILDCQGSPAAHVALGDSEQGL